LVRLFLVGFLLLFLLLTLLLLSVLLLILLALLLLVLLLLIVLLVLLLVLLILLVLFLLLLLLLLLLQFFELLLHEFVVELRVGVVGVDGERALIAFERPLPKLLGLFGLDWPRRKSALPRLYRERCCRVRSADDVAFSNSCEARAKSLL
jgi:hypothetical protein